MMKKDIKVRQIVSENIKDIKYVVIMERVDFVEVYRNRRKNTKHVLNSNTTKSIFSFIVRVLFPD